MDNCNHCSSVNTSSIDAFISLNKVFIIYLKPAGRRGKSRMTCQKKGAKTPTFAIQETAIIYCWKSQTPMKINMF
jgi:hypothetical protein